MQKKVGIISAGAWGTALGEALAQNGHNVKMWDFMSDVVDDINQNNRNNKFLYGVTLSKSITATADLLELTKDRDFLILASPSKFLIPIVKQIITAPSIQDGIPTIGIITKGFVDKDPSPLFLTDAIENILPGIYKEKLVYISGPSHAEEVARGKITGLIAASKNGKNAVLFKNLLNGKTLKVFPSLDVEGVQTSAAIKNVIATAYGMLDALTALNDQFGDNTESLLFAAGLNEIMTLGTALGSKYPETFTSLAGVGDLDVTCKSKYGRNRRFGREIVRDKKLQRYTNIEDLMENIGDIGYLPEGVFAANCAVKFIKEKHLKLPIIEAVYKVFNREIEPEDIFSSILDSKD